MSSVTIKQGETFRLAATFFDGTPEVPTSLTVAGATPRSQLRRLGLLTAELTVALSNQTTLPGQFVISATSTQTTSWPVGSHECDVRYTYSNGEVKTTGTFAVVVIPRVTE